MIYKDLLKIYDHMLCNIRKFTISTYAKQALSEGKI